MKQDLIQFINSAMPNNNQNHHITDNFFLAVQNNPRFLNHYFELCNNYTKRSTNRMIGRIIKEQFALPNNGKIKSNSYLIKTYTLH